MVPKPTKPAATMPGANAPGKVKKSAKAAKPSSGRSKSTEAPSILSQIATQPLETSIDRRGPKKAQSQQESVLMRPTVWAQREKAEMNGISPQNIKMKGYLQDGDQVAARREDASVEDDARVRNGVLKERILINGLASEKPEDEFPRTEGTSNAKQGQKLLMINLPKELRDKVWRFVVKRNKSLIDPTTPTGSEQPDLAMTCRLIRTEALSIFYAENIFRIEAFELLANADVQEIAGDADKKRRTQRQSVAFADWASAMERAGWFCKIRRWCIECRVTPHVLNIAPCGVDDQMLMVSLVLKGLERKRWGAEVEVHRDAYCVLPGCDPGKCVVETTPIWLNAAVIELLDEARGREVDGTAVMRLSRALQTRAEDLANMRCAQAA